MAAVARGVCLALAALVSCRSGNETAPARDAGRLEAISDACTELARVWCSSYALCRSGELAARYGDEAGCVERRARLCAGTEFGPGSTVTPDDIRRCAADSDLSALDDDARCEQW